MSAAPQNRTPLINAVNLRPSAVPRLPTTLHRGHAPQIEDLLRSAWLKVPRTRQPVSSRVHLSESSLGASKLAHAGNRHFLQLATCKPGPGPALLLRCLQQNLLTEPSYTVLGLTYFQPSPPVLTMDISGSHSTD